MRSLVSLIPFLTLIIIILFVRSRKNIKAIKRSGLVKWSLGIGVLSALACILFGFLGFRNNDAGTSCPASYPYADAVIVTGLIGLTALIIGSALAFQSRQKQIGFLTALCAVDLISIAAAAWFTAVLCFTF